MELESPARPSPDDELSALISRTFRDETPAEKAITCFRLQELLSRESDPVDEVRRRLGSVAIRSLPRETPIAQPLDSAALRPG